MQVEFFAPMTPPTRTEQQHRVFFKNGRPVFFRDAKLREAISQLERAVAPYVPISPLEGAVYVKIIWCFPYRKTEKKSLIGEAIPKDTRPDIDNLNKNLLDVLNKKIIADDSQIVRLTVEKCWYHTPGIYVKVSQIDHQIFSGKVEACIEKAYLKKSGRAETDFCSEGD